MILRLYPLLLRLCLLLLLFARPLFAAPLLDSRVGGMTLTGPAIGHLASIYSNPATLSLLPGFHLFATGTFRYGPAWSERRTVEPSTGQPTALGSSSRQSFTEISPHYFFGLSSDLGSESIVFALSFSNPVFYRFSDSQQSADRFFDAAAQGPSRYHVVDLDLGHFYNTISAAIRIIDQLSLGLSFSYIYGRMGFSFVRDTALEGGKVRDTDEPVALDDCGEGQRCDYESSAAAEAVRVQGSSYSIGIGAGILVRPRPSVTIGLGYSSKVVGLSGDTISSEGDAWVRRSQAAISGAGSTGPVARDLTGRSTVDYVLPDMIHLDLAWQAKPRLLLDLQFRWINFSVHDALAVRLTGSQLRTYPPIPDRIVHYRGFQDVYDIQLGASYQLRPSLEVQGALMAETAAVPNEAVSAAAIDRFKIDSLVSLRWSLTPHWVLSGGYGLVWMPTIDVKNSTFSPTAMVDCVDGRYDVDLPECKQASAGHGLPSAAGKYSLITHRLGMGLSVEY